MNPNDRLKRFVEAQARSYPDAVKELRNGRKTSHWMWYIFPQIAGLGFSETSKFYALNDVDEARRYLTHEVLGPRLIELSTIVLGVQGKTAYQIFGSPDDLKLKSCMTLFSLVENTDPVFDQVLAKFFAGERDGKTLKIVQG